MHANLAQNVILGVEIIIWTYFESILLGVNFSIFSHFREFTRPQRALWGSLRGRYLGFVYYSNGLSRKWSGFEKFHFWLEGFRCLLAAMHVKQNMNLKNSKFGRKSSELLIQYRFSNKFGFNNTRTIGIIVLQKIEYLNVFNLAFVTGIEAVNIFK